MTLTHTPDSLDIVSGALSHLSHRARTLDTGPLEEPALHIFSHLAAPPDAVISHRRSLPAYQAATLVLAVEAYADDRPEESTSSAAQRWSSVRGHERYHDDLVAMLSSCRRGGSCRGAPVEYRSVDVGPASTMSVPVFGLLDTHSPGGIPVAVALHIPDPAHQAPLQIEVLSGDRDAGASTLDALLSLMTDHDVMRGQVLTLGGSGGRGNGLVRFMARPTVAGEDLILPDGTLEAMTRHLVTVGSSAARLREAGQHVGRGILLYGPPGTGKTHTVRHLLGLVPDSTVIVLTGSAMRHIAEATTLARRLSPSVVVVEDVDLIAREREETGVNSLLFALLDAMDGMDGDADVTFVLTTNRPDSIERAVRDRPGRIDLAVEIPLPDTRGRERLARLYLSAVNVAADLTPLVEATEGGTASYVRELVRRTVVAAIERDDHGADGHPTVITDDDVAAVLTACVDERQRLTRSLLGGSGVRPAG
ncbi:ATP-binding protein [Rhodococcus sp. NBC_00294]|uniref:ATP-binding protein n=1 Tax=Rhodococcus sp. NBC_00294 TaxID=2976004 RepID=UPI002E282107|nr:ATP-binding protein [Rhodococcus sp. NBC_00294]